MVDWGDERSLLVYAFEARVTESMKAAFAEKTPIDLAVILGRLTSVLQPVNVSLKKPRNDGVRKRWMADGIDGHQKKALGRNHRSVDRCCIAT